MIATEQTFAKKNMSILSKITFKGNALSVVGPKIQNRDYFMQNTLRENDDVVET